MYCLFSVKKDLEVDNVNQKYDIKSSVNDILSKQEQRLEFLTRIVDPRWFLYSVKIHNNIRFAVVSDNANPPYIERETMLTLVTDREILVPYGKDSIVSSIRREEILEKFNGYKFSFEGDPNQIFPPNSYVKIQHSPALGSAYLKISPTYGSLFLIYFFAFLAWSSFLVLMRTMFQYIYFGNKWWFKV